MEIGINRVWQALWPLISGDRFWRICIYYLIASHLRKPNLHNIGWKLTQSVTWDRSPNNISNLCIADINKELRCSNLLDQTHSFLATLIHHWSLGVFTIELFVTNCLLWNVWSTFLCIENVTFLSRKYIYNGQFTALCFLVFSGLCFRGPPGQALRPGRLSQVLCHHCHQEVIQC